MARNRFLLSCALRHVFLNDFGLDRVFIMNDLAALFLYYADEAVPEELSAEFNRLNVWLTKAELLKKPRKDEAYPTPKDFNINLNSSDELNVTSFHFSPNINMPEIPQYSFDGRMLDELADELSEIDVAALASYVRTKALEAGDLSLEMIDGDREF